MEHDVYGIQFQYIIQYDGDSIERNLPERRRADVHKISLDVNQEYLPILLDFEPLNETSVSPLHAYMTENTFRAPVEVQAPPSEPIKFRLFLTSEKEEKRIQSFDVNIPSFQVLDWTYQILTRTYNENLFEEISPRYDQEDEAGSIISFLDNILPYLNPDQFLRIVDSCAETSVIFREVVDEVYTPKSIARHLPGGDFKNSFELDSWPKIRQFCTTSDQLRYAPTYEESQIVEAAVDVVSNTITNNVETDMDRLWEIDQALDISKRYPEVLEYHQFIALVAKAATNRRLDRVTDLAQYWNSNTSIDDVQEAIENAKNPDADRVWEDLLICRDAVDAATFNYILSSFLQDAGESKGIDLLHSVTAYQAAAELSDRIGNSKIARSLRFEAQYLRGKLYLDKDQFEKAVADLREARYLALDEMSEEGEAKYTNLAGSWVRLYEAEVKMHRANRDFSQAIATIEDGIESAKRYEQFSEDSKQWCLSRLNALFNEVKGDKQLDANKLKEALNFYGKAIGNMNKSGQNLENQITFLKNRRSGIKGSIAESDGEYSEAANQYEKIVERSRYEDAFVRFHEDRAKICRAKQAIADRNTRKARKCLENIEYEVGRLRDEVNFLANILDMIQLYQKRKQKEVDDVVSMLKSMSEFDETDIDTDFGYGHDYRPALISLYTAQRLQTVLDERDGFLDTIVDIAINDVLKPNDLEEILYQAEVQTDTNWQGNLPIFITRQVQEISRAAEVKRQSDNYKSQAESLTGCLEECIELVVSYEARKQFGDDWPEETSSNGNVSLGNLAGYLNNSTFDDMPWAEDIRRLFAVERFDDITLDTKDGDIVDVRNDLHHNNVSRIDKQEFERIDKHIQDILASLSSHIPVLGVVGEQNAYGAYSVRLLRGGVQDEVEILIDNQIENGHVYFFPHSTATSDGVVEIENDEVQPCKEEDLLESIDSHSEVSTIRWERLI